MSTFLWIIQNIRWQDVLDILVVAFIIYRIFLLIKGTRALQMLVGLAIILLVFLAARKIELLTLSWIINNFITYFILVIIILFQSDLRRMLTRMGEGPFFGSGVENLQIIEDVIGAAVNLSNHKIGALIVLERRNKLNDYIEMGTPLDAMVKRELIISLFHPRSPLHDGAVIIQNGRISAAGCYLPLTTNPRVSKSYGTRHRAAIGLSEETDAIVVVVSEETSRISVAVGGKLTKALDSATLKRVLQSQFAGERKEEEKPGKEKESHDEVVHP